METKKASSTPETIDLFEVLFDKVLGPLNVVKSAL